MEPSPSRDANSSIKFYDFYGIRIQTAQFATCKHSGPNFPSLRFPQLFLMIYFTFVLPLTPRPSNWCPSFCIYSFSESPVRISRFSYLVVLDVFITVSCREHKPRTSSPRNLLQSPVTSSILGPISSPAPAS